MYTIKYKKLFEKLTKEHDLILLDSEIQEIENCIESDLKKLNLHRVSGSTCKEHKPMSKQMGYVEWNEWAELKIRRGHIQRQCKICGKWFFKCEQ